MQNRKLLTNLKRAQATVFEEIPLEVGKGEKREGLGTRIPRYEKGSKHTPKRTALVRYEFNPELAAPIRGETVSVCHVTSVDRNGKATINRGSVEVRKVKLVYFSDAQGHRIQDHVGDVWYVRPAAVGGTKWETFIPGDKQKVVIK